jgi:MFS family permease
MRKAGVANLLLALLVTSLVINYLDRGALSVSAPQISRDLQLTPADMGVLFSAFFWSYASFQLVAGALVDRYPLRWVYAVAFLIWSLATAAVGLVESFGALLVARLFLGVGESVAFPASSKIIVRFFPEERRGLANALVDVGTKAGPGLSTLLGGLAVAHYGWRAMFLVAGLGSLVWLIPWLLLRVPEEIVEPGAEAKRPGWGDMLRLRQLWGTSLGMFALGYVWYFLLSWLPTYLVQERGLSMSSMATLGSTPFWAMGLASLAGGWSSDRWIARGASPSRVRMSYAVAGLLLCGVAILPAAIVSSADHSIALITAACVFLGLFTSNVWAISQTLAGPLAAGRWTGIQNAIGNLGGVLSPLFTGWIVKETGSFSLAFWAAAGVLLLGAASYWIMVGKIQPVQWKS